MKNQWFGPLAVGQGNGAALNTSTTPTSILPAQAKYTLPSNFFDVLGVKLGIRASGKISSFSTAPQLTLDVRFGSTVVFNGGASPNLIVSQTNLTWELDLLLTCKVIGASAQLSGGGSLKSLILTGGLQMLPATSPDTLGTAFDAGAAQVVDLFATWNNSNASNNIQLVDYQLYSPN